MAVSCLIPKVIDNLKDAFKTGKIDPDKLMSMSSAERRQLLTDVIGKETAHDVNVLIEGKLLLKNQKQGIVNAIKKMVGIPEKDKSELIALKANRLNEYLDPNKMDKYLEDLAQDKVGRQYKIIPTTEETNKIMELSRKIEGASRDVGKDEISNFGRATFELNKYVGDLTPGEKGVSGTLANISSIQRAVQTGLDVSAIGRQGGSYFGRKEWFGATKRVAGYIKSEKNMDKLAMKMYSDPKWEIISKYKEDLGLTNLGAKMTQREEVFASKLIKKVPGLNMSERAYTGFLSDLRFNRFKNTINALEKRGFKLGDEELKALAQEIGVGTGRGYLPGSLKMAGNALSTALFSPRWFASKIELVTDPFRKGIPKVARIEATKNLATVAGIATGSILALKASGLNVEIDPRSSDFGKLKVGNTRIDLTFGQGQYIRMMAQIASGTTKSTRTGEFKKLSTGEFGTRTRLDVVTDFIEGKAAPNISLILDFLEGQDWEGTKLGVDFKNIKSEKNTDALARVLNMFIPLTASDAIETFYDASGNTKEGLRNALWVGALAQIGVGVQTYGDRQKVTENLGIDQRNIIERTLKLPAKPPTEFKSLIDKMVKEGISVSVPGTKTTIKPRGAKESRPMTDKELEIYQTIYRRNLKSNLLKKTNFILRLTGNKLDKEINKIKTKTTEKSKIELLKQMGF